MRGYFATMRAQCQPRLIQMPAQLFHAVIAATFAGQRLDKTLSELLPDHSRAAIQQWLKQGRVRVDDKLGKQTMRVVGGEAVEVDIPPPDIADWAAQKIDFDIVHRDADLWIIDKPAGVVVHPGAGQADRTLLNGLLHIDDSLRALPRAGIVHRLDKDTSGLLAVARNESARQHLIAQLQMRDMKRGYLAVVCGVPISGERIDQPIGRHRHDRLRMCVTDSGKPAATQISIVRKFRAHCLLRAELESGRTHQIRVHLQWRGFPLVGDKRYGGRLQLPADAADTLRETLRQFPRQALHAARLSLTHPRAGKICEWESAMPPDMENLIEQLGRD